jgi:parvulin-like peptidyl-prolyl isomerase
VAKRSSQGLTASQGGGYDWTKRGSLVDKGLEDALFSIPLNELSDFIETKQGVHIVRVLERMEDGKIPFLEAQAGIKETLIEENRNQAFEEHLIRLRKEIPHEIIWKSN